MPDPYSLDEDEDEEDDDEEDEGDEDGVDDESDELVEGLEPLESDLVVLALGAGLVSVAPFPALE